MVATPPDAWRLPPGPASLGVQIERAFALWLRSAKPLFGFALVFSLAELLPLLTLGELGARALKVMANLVVYAFDPTQPEPDDDPGALADAIGAWLSAPSTWALIALSVGLAVYALTAMILRQHRIAHGEDRGFAAAAASALRLLPSAFASWLVYALAMLLFATVLFGFAWVMWLWAWQTSLAGLLTLLMAFLLGSALLSIPLAWASVAFGFAPILASIEARQPFATHGESRRLVRGHWAPAATMMTVPTLIHFGVSGTVSSLLYVLLALIVLAVAGLPAVLDGQWLLWAQWLGAIPTALALPLALAGFTVSLHDLRQHKQAPP